MKLEGSSEPERVSTVQDRGRSLGWLRNEIVFVGRLDREGKREAKLSFHRSK